MTSFPQVKVKKSQEILDQFEKSIKIYIKMFEAGGLLPAQVELKLFFDLQSGFYVIFSETP